MLLEMRMDNKTNKLSIIEECHQGLQFFKRMQAVRMDLEETILTRDLLVAAWNKTTLLKNQDLVTALKK